mgnify:CR=1 FL=1
MLRRDQNKVTPVVAGGTDGEENEAATTAAAVARIGRVASLDAKLHSLNAPHAALPLSPVAHRVKAASLYCIH